MGIKENFAQAVKELTGGGRDEKAADKKAAQVENLRKAVEDEGVAPRGEFSDYSPPQEPVQEEPPRPDSNQAAAGEMGRMADTEDTTRYYQSNVPPLMPYGAVYQSSAPKPESEPVSQPGYQSRPQQINQPQTTYTAQGISGRGAEQQTPFSTANMGNLGSQFSSQPSITPQRPSYSEEEITVISKNTVVDGNIRSFANMMIDGDIKGDIETTKNIDLNGKVIGNLICNNAEMHTSQIQGNIRLKGNVVMERDTLLIGDLVSTYAKINGKIKGNIDISGKAEFKSDSVIFGDISASTITVGDGAIIQGYVSTTFLSKEESINIFPETITIGE